MSEATISIINKLQDALALTGGNDHLDLPQIIVVGEQSSGKSSVLEHIVQRDFLPRGSGIVTRRPLVLQLLRASDTSEYAEFLHLPSQKIFDFEQIRLEITKETDRLAGENKNISNKPIYLKMYLKNVLPLTLIDLPGLTKIPIGDQPHNIGSQIKQLVLDYITKPNSIILSVTPATIDLANSDSLKLARQVDPQGKRTMGVISKLDLMDAGTNALDVLTGQLFPLKLGFVGVVNRSQQDILTNKPMEDAVNAEDLFFKTHPAYKSISGRCGSHYLAKQLNHVLIRHIREKLPELRTKLSSLIGQTQHELSHYGEPAISKSSDNSAMILKLLTLFSNEFVSSIDGTSTKISTKELSGGARIYHIFRTVFKHALDAIHPCTNLSNEDIRTAMRNSAGPRGSLFVPELAFELLVRPQIRMLEAPSLRCVHLAYEELSKICHTCGSKEVTRFPQFHTRLTEVVADLLHERLEPTLAYVESLVSIECSYINTNHPEFPSAADAFKELDKKYKEQESMERKRLARQYLNNEIAVNRNSRSMSITSTTSSISSFSSKNSLLNQYVSNQQDRHSPTFNPEQTIEETQSAAIMANLEDSIKTKPTEKEEREVELIRYLIIAYFNIVRKSIQDLVPKAIMHFLVNYTRDNVQNQLVSLLYRENLFENLLKEDPAISSERERCRTMLEVYRRAFSLVNEAS
ncbi:Dynamin central region-domain-containing protein [Sporodiniella umbellata]|nr:Dynamin central region-domain-containing protein [Sporodiniella umbellata]